METTYGPPRECGAAAVRDVPATDGRKQNWIIAALPAEERTRLEALLKPVQLQRGQMLGDNNEHPTAWLPIDSVVGLVQMLRDGSVGEVATIGCEGIVGLLRMGFAQKLRGRLVVHISGDAWQINMRLLRAQASQGGRLGSLLWEYLPDLVSQIAMTALCNRHHTLYQQLCRRLLHWSDLVESPRLALTQESIAHSLGVRREGVSESASRLREAGIISYCRGQITVLDRATLLRHACECYALLHGQRAALAYAPPQHASCR